ncbi:MAG: hypothetical protein U9Q88_17825 [Bacillota bacterium]|uniref:hypothetical protein n=1 Tax=Bacillus sp. RO2 TaxID=2723913 RepID=UPI00145F0576|nr:hypothetical protein [Bacillus sp. RO2]MEA3321853.1 hypothetical protein [Bacillota bacterium]NMH73095.1 hypothetical protein [Bacillus sp. RO2]
MSYYLGLMSKEWKVSLKGLWQNYLFILIFWLVGIGASFSLNQPSVAIAVSLTIVSIHIFYMGTDMVMNLVKEQRLKIWLHNPNPVRSLISSKLVISLVHCLISISIAIVFYAISTFISGQPFLQGKMFIEGLALIWSILGFGLYLCVWAVYFWSRFAAARGKPGEFIRAIIGGVIAYVAFQVHEGFRRSIWFEGLNEVGSFPAVSIGTKVLESEDGYQEISMGVTMSDFSLGLVAVFTLISMILFFLTVRNVKKIEV